MKIIVLGMLLTVMQAAPPVPRHTADKANSSAKNIKDSPSNGETPAASPSPVPNMATPTPEQPTTSNPGTPNTKQPITVGELPPVSITKDWMDRTAWLFGLAVLIVGGIGVRAAYRTLKKLEEQATEMSKQRVAMEGQLTTMQGQFGEMQKQAAEVEKQTLHLGGSVAAAKMSAEAAKLSADIAARVSIPRLVIEKFEVADAGTAKLADMLQYPNVKIVIKNYGQTPALLKFWNIVFTCEELTAEPVYWNEHSSSIILEKDVIEPNQPYTIPPIPPWKRAELSPEDVEAVINYKKKLWAYGFICYDDIFRSARWRMKFCEFALNVREGWIQWEGCFAPPVYQGTEEFPWGLAGGGGQKPDNPNEAKQPN